VCRPDGQTIKARSARAVVSRVAKTQRAVLDTRSRVAVLVADGKPVAEYS